MSQQRKCYLIFSSYCDDTGSLFLVLGLVLAIHCMYDNAFVLFLFSPWAMELCSQCSLLFFLFCFHATGFCVHVLLTGFEWFGSHNNNSHKSNTNKKNIMTKPIAKCETYCQYFDLILFFLLSKLWQFHGCCFTLDTCTEYFVFHSFSFTRSSRSAKKSDGFVSFKWRFGWMTKKCMWIELELRLHWKGLYKKKQKGIRCSFLPDPTGANRLLKTLPQFNRKKRSTIYMDIFFLTRNASAIKWTPSSSHHLTPFLGDEWLSDRHAIAWFWLSKRRNKSGKWISTFPGKLRIQWNFSSHSSGCLIVTSQE